MQLETVKRQNDLPHLKIQKVEAIPISVKYKMQIKTFYGTREHAHAVLVKIHADDGFVGLGEGGATIPLYLGETQATIISVIKDILAPNTLIGEDPLNIDRIVTKMDSLILGNTQAKACIDIALHDLVGKILNVPLNRLLGGAGQESVPMGWVATASDANELSDEAGRAAHAGFNHVNIKVAVNPDPEEDIKRFAAVRSTVGENVKLTIDANTGWTPYVAAHTIEKLKKYDIYAAEQPTKDISGLREVKERTGVSILIDESARKLSDLNMIITSHAADVLGIKVARVGGLYRTRQLVTVAESADMPVEMLSTVGSGILSSAEAHMVTSNSWFKKWGAGHKTASGVLALSGGFDTRNYGDDIVESSAKVENGRLSPPSGPGLGVELNEDALLKCLSQGLKPAIIT